MASSIVVNVRYANLRSGFRDYVDEGLAPRSVGLQRDHIKEFHPYSWPGDVNVYSIIVAQAAAGVREDYFVQETVTAINSALNAAEA